MAAQSSSRSSGSGGGVGMGPPEIQPQEIEKYFVLGDGSFGTVFQGRCRGKDVAVKVLHKQDLDPSTLDAFRKEVEIVSRIFHPNVVLFMGACTVPGHMSIVTELMPKGNLESLLSDPNFQISLTKRMEMARDAALGMNWLHGSHPPIIHRDLKASNLLVDENLSVKLSDFGLSQVKQSEHLYDGSEGAKGTPLWMAPEVLLCRPFNEKADVYSFGLVLWEMLTRKEPYSEYRNFRLFREDICSRHIRPAIPSDTNPTLSSLISMCWAADSSVRPSFTDIITFLERIIVECAIVDGNGRRFWLSKFPKFATVKWDDFLDAFLDFIHEMIVLDPNERLPVNAPPHYLIRANVHQLDEFKCRDQQSFFAAMKEIERRQRLNQVIPTNEQKLQCTTLLNQKTVECLQYLLAESSRYDPRQFDVNIERFGQMCEWFGPLDFVFNSEGVATSVVFLDNIFETLKQIWFHGFLTTTEAETYLATQSVGTYLVRFSTTSPGAYAVSSVGGVDRKGQKEIVHRRITRTPNGQFAVSGMTFPSLKEIIRCDNFNFHVPCPGSRIYADLFVEKKQNVFESFSFLYMFILFSSQREYINHADIT